MESILEEDENQVKDLPMKLTKAQSGEPGQFDQTQASALTNSDRKPTQTAQLSNANSLRKRDVGQKSN